MLSKLNWLLQLIKENPDLPVIPIVDSEVTNDCSNRLIGSNRWRACIGDAEIRMYLERKDGITLYSDCDYFITLISCGLYTQEECEYLSDDELGEAYDSLPWKKAIFVKIIEN